MDVQTHVFPQIHEAAVTLWQALERGNQVRGGRKAVLGGTENDSIWGESQADDK